MERIFHTMIFRRFNRFSISCKFQIIWSKRRMREFLTENYVC